MTQGMKVDGLRQASHSPVIAKPLGNILRVEFPPVYPQEHIAFLDSTFQAHLTDSLVRLRNEWDDSFTSSFRLEIVSIPNQKALVIQVNVFPSQVDQFTGT